MFMRLPNAFNNYHLNETVEAIGPWTPLVGKCHRGLKLFLCAIYAPICLQDKESGMSVSIRLCKSFCWSVRASCEPVMNANQHKWPTHPAFNCSEYVDDSMCVREDFIAATPTPAPTPSGNDVCNMRDDVLARKVCSSDLVLRAEVSSIRDARGQGSYTVLKIKRHQKKSGRMGSRSSRKAKKTSDNPERVLVRQTECRNEEKTLKEGHSYLIVLDKRSLKKKTKYIVKAIVPWKNKKYRKLMRRNHCKQR